LNATEISRLLDSAERARGLGFDATEIVQSSLTHLLISPDFLYRVETSEPDPRNAGKQRLDAYSLASRISFLIWDAPPDAALLDAAESGQLYEQSGLKKQVNRMIESPKFRDGIRAFFSDMYGFEHFNQLSKDQTLYPLYNRQVAENAREQLLRTIVHNTIDLDLDFRELFATKFTFMNRRLGALYQLPVTKDAVDGWAPFTFEDDDPRAGLLTLAGFLMLDPTHEGRSSPTNRGKYIRELYLCQEVPLPPPDVDFSVVLDTTNEKLKTARERLTAHRTHPTCAGCHAITDPIGLAFENYDAIGQYRSHENGALIDATGEFENTHYENALSLQEILRESPDLTSCLVKRVYEYTVGHPAKSGQLEWLHFIDTRFGESGYKLKSLVKAIATSSAISLVNNDPSLAAAH